MTALEIKHDLLKLIVATDDTDILGQVRDYFQGLRTDTIPDGPDMSIEEIDRLLLQSETSERISDNDFWKRFGV